MEGGENRSPESPLRLSSLDPDRRSRSSRSRAQEPGQRGSTPIKRRSLSSPKQRQKQGLTRPRLSSNSSGPARTNSDVSSPNRNIPDSFCSKPHPNECSGSDLDGDIYCVSWDPALIPPLQDPAMNYKPATSKILDHDVTIEEVQEYFTKYIINDSLGIISNAHTVFADREPLKARSDPCIELAMLFSIAVDFPKTGEPAEIPPHLYVKEYPDFMEKPDKATYISQGVIGKLFRGIKDRKPPGFHLKSFTKEVARMSYDRDMEVDGFKDYIDDAIWFKDNYDFKLGNLMEHYGMTNEAEILTGNLAMMSKKFNKYKDGEAVRLAVKSLKKEVRKWVDEDIESNAAYTKASACYHVTYHPDYWGTYNEGLNRPHFLSFPWCVYDKLITIRKQKMTCGRAASVREMQLWSQRERGLNFFLSSG